MLQFFTLSNGMSVAMYSMPDLRSVQLQMSIKGGSLGETIRDNGLAHFMEHMLVQGVPSFPNAQLLSAYIESIAGSYSAYTSDLLVSFDMSVPYSHAEDAIRIASEVFFEPLFPADAIEKERQAVLNEIKQDMDSHWYKFNKFFRDNRYAVNSPLLQKTVGNLDIAARLGREDFINYWKKYFVPKNTYLFLCGNISEAKMRPILENYFGKFQSKKTFPGFVKLSRNDLSERKVAIRNDKTLQVNYLCFSFPSLSFYDDVKLLVKQNIALTILGKLRTSRLFQLLRYKKGLVYGVFAGDSQFPGVGYGYITSEVSDEHLDEVVQLIVKELAAYRDNGPLDAELKLAKNYMSNSWLMSFDSPTSIVDWVSRQLVWREQIRLPEEYIKMIQDVTAKDIVDVMLSHWDMTKLQLTIQGPIEETEENNKKFTQLLKPF